MSKNMQIFKRDLLQRRQRKTHKLYNNKFRVMEGISKKLWSKNRNCQNYRAVTTSCLKRSLRMLKCKSIPLPKSSHSGKIKDPSLKTLTSFSRALKSTATDRRLREILSCQIWRELFTYRSVILCLLSAQKTSKISLKTNNSIPLK